MLHVAASELVKYKFFVSGILGIPVIFGSKFKFSRLLRFKFDDFIEKFKWVIGY